MIIWSHVSVRELDAVKTKITKTLLKSLEIKDKPYEIKDTETTGFHIRVYPSGKVSYYYAYINTKGRRNRVLVGKADAMTLQQAKDKVANYVSDVANGIDIQAEKKTAKKHIEQLNKRTLYTYLDEQYRPWVSANHKRKDEVIKTIKASFKDYKDWPLTDITLEELEKWRIKKKKAGLKATTINRQVNALSGAMSKAVQWKVIPSHPFKGIGDLKVDKKPKHRYLSESENKRLFKVLAERDQELKEARERGNQHRAERGYDLMPVLIYSGFADRMTPLITLSLKTGMRRGEVFDLTWEHVNFDQRLITVTGDTAKSGNTRTIPMSALVYDTLTAWREQAPKTDDNRVFPADERKGGRLDNVRKSWASILERANINDFRWHDMRHDFASQLVMKGVPLNTVRDLCGHAQFETTLRYADLSADHKAEAVALLD